MKKLDEMEFNNSIKEVKKIWDTIGVDSNGKFDLYEVKDVDGGHHLVVIDGFFPVNSLNVMIDIFNELHKNFKFISSIDKTFNHLWFNKKYKVPLHDSRIDYLTVLSIMVDHIAKKNMIKDCNLLISTMVMFTMWLNKK